MKTKNSESSGDEAPDKKRPKTQTNLFSFFDKSSTAAAKPKPTAAPPSSPSPSAAPASASASAKHTPSNKDSKPSAKIFHKRTPPSTPTAKEAKKSSVVALDGVKNGPIHPQKVPERSNVHWKSYYDNHLIIRKVSKQEPRTKVAALDMDGTLLAWLVQYPSRFEQYELWSTTIIPKLRDLHDNQGYKLCIISNQGIVRSAHTGKKATTVKAIIDWLEEIIDRPLFAIMSTKSPKASSDSYHKPSHKLWKAAEDLLNKRIPFDIAESFFVGDSVIDDPQDSQGGVDERFAQNVSKSTGVPLKFYNPKQYFGPSDLERRSNAKALDEVPPTEALEARAALLGGYLQGPILLVLCGIQGSGKSTFCQQLIGTAQGKEHWVQFSQDTINDGKPGKREVVEARTRDALENGQSVIVDRTHLDAAQRKHFINVANSVSDYKVPVHCVVLDPPKNVIVKRVRERTNHPGKVQGEKGAQLAIRSNIIPPKYEEGFALISRTATEIGVLRISDSYSRVSDHDNLPTSNPMVLNEAMLLDASSGIALPQITLGMYGVGKRSAQNIVESALAVGFRSVDTAPTYGNEGNIGVALEAADDTHVFSIVKIPKRATTPEQVATELESSLEKLSLEKASILLLHWPSDVTTAGTLDSVWKEMEKCVEKGLCKGLGVCNFNEAALVELLSNCTIRPLINQVERHPLLPQWKLLDFCARNDIILQAHTSLGQASPELMQNDVVQSVALDSSLTPAQVLLQYNLQSGIPVVCKCSTKEHQEEAYSSTNHHLTSKHMQDLNSIGTNPKRFVDPPFMYGKAAYCWGERRPTKP